jgi:hypothetical protein
MLLCSVFKLDATDIHLLYKSLVVLPQDKQDQAPSVEDISKAKPAESNVLSVKREEKKIETPESTSPVEEKNTPATTVAPVTIAEEAKATYRIESHPFVLFTSEANKNKYLAEDSNFAKAIGALKITQLTKYITSDPTVLESLSSYECIWCMGIDLNSEKKILAQKHQNILISPDIESLATVDEKKRMFSALKAFVTPNMDLFSKI